MSKEPKRINKELEFNGRNTITFREVWELHKGKRLVPHEMAHSSIRVRLGKVEFLSPLFDYRMREITSRVITEHIESERNKALSMKDTKKSRRCNFKDDLKVLNAIFSCWRGYSDDERFINPICKAHFTKGFIKETHYKELAMTKKELLLFCEKLGDKTIWQDIAITQFFLAGRIQEALGLQSSRVLFEADKILVKEVAVFYHRFAGHGAVYDRT
ncbi:MAG: hypothetical protein HQK50_06975 [Oligoflexia bacterium]|nr:hypothetical protein [Oligoflexia bacterium]